MKITDLELKCFIKRIEKKYPNKTSCFFYDKKNLQGEYRKLGHALKWTWKIIDELCHDDEIQNFYIRLHKFHNWYIIRIGGNGKITFKMEKSMYEISGENIIQILNSENKEFIITASYTEL